MYKSLFIRGVLPTIIIIILFSASVFGIIVPSFERSILEQKREMIRELTNSAWNILAKFENDERSGIISRAEAQKAVISQIQNLHYGSEMKDYFWIHDTGPVMVIHPYRTDLNGQNLSEFKDPRGKRLFVEMTELVKRGGAGYVDYMWQRKDDAALIVPKLSYVKGFAPWGWIIGTGVYLDDVETEIKNLRRNIVLVSLVIIISAAFILFYLLIEHFRAEYGRVKTEAALRASEEKYRTLVESAGEGIIMAISGERLFANQNILQRLGYEAEEFSKLAVDDVIVATEEEISSGGPYYKKLINGEAAPKRYASRLKTRDGAEIGVMLSIAGIDVQNKSGFIAIATDISRSRMKDIVQEKVINDLQSAFMNFSQPVGAICEKEPISFPLSESCVAAVKKMRECGRRSAVVKSADGSIAGILSYEDIFDEKFVELFVKGKPISEFKSLAPPAAVSSSTMAFEAARVLEKNSFRPLLITFPDGAMAGILEKDRLLMVQNYSPAVFLREIATASSPGDVHKISRRLAELVRILVLNGVKAFNVNHFITQSADSILERLISFALEKMGKPPAPFVFLVMGSEGRFEQTLKTDQDNAILYQDVPAEERAAADEYFSGLGKLVCGWLEEAGYSNCAGGIMAKNPKWCQPMSVWKNYFAEWITKAGAEELLKTKIFFDFRGAWGETKFADELRSSLRENLENTPQFFFLLARDVLRFEPPIGLFGNFTRDGSKGDEIDIKAVMTFIVDFARIYALRSALGETNTSDRLAALQEKGVLKESSYDEMAQAYSYLMNLRLLNQVRKYADKGAADNGVDPYSLTSIDQKMLKEIFAQIKHFQVRLSYDFTGMSERL
ncbi:MAG: Methyl-accepting chemotaxis protein 4 [bacterium ADurb.Bin243]|nr:MAG: Methyl-accepting chemotaxis protein 4 [bacterium ADurb.Bin243]